MTLTRRALIGLLCGLPVSVEARQAVEREDRTYHKVSIPELATTKWTHVQVEGLVTVVRRQADGDTHIRMTDPSGAFIMAEVVPWRPVATVRKGQRIRVFGIARYDKGHGWPEVHPVEHLEVLPPLSDRKPI